jgi:hypothetical protein
MFDHHRLFGRQLHIVSPYCRPDRIKATASPRGCGKPARAFRAHWRLHPGRAAPPLRADRIRRHKLRLASSDPDGRNSLADILDTANSEIKLLKTKRAALKRQKRGLMQKLLTGDWPVPLRDGEVDDLAERAATGEAA